MAGAEREVAISTQSHSGVLPWSSSFWLFPHYIIAFLYIILTALHSCPLDNNIQIHSWQTAGCKGQTALTEYSLMGRLFCCWMFWGIHAVIFVMSSFYRSIFSYNFAYHSHLSNKRVCVYIACCVTFPSNLLAGISLWIFCLISAFRVFWMCSLQLSGCIHIKSKMFFILTSNHKVFCMLCLYVPPDDLYTEWNVQTQVFMFLWMQHCCNILDVMCISSNSSLLETLGYPLAFRRSVDLNNVLLHSKNC